jgi:ribonuclease E
MDRARVQIGRISRFGLLELSRQRLRPSLGESAHQTCPRCNGSGSIRGVESLALAVLRLVGEEARKDRSSKVIAQLPVDVATYLLNEKRDWIRAIEERDHVQVILVANPHLETPNYTLRRVRDDQVTAPENTGASYTLAAQEQPPSDAALDLFAPRVKPDEPAVVPPMPPTPAPPPPPEFVIDEQPRPVAAQATPASPGLVQRFLAWLGGSGKAAPAPARPAQGDGERRPQPSGNRHDGGRNRGGQHGRGRRDERHRDDRNRDDRNRGGRGPGGQGGNEQREGRGEGREGREGRDQRGPRPQRQDGGGRQHERHDGGGRQDARRGDDSRRDEPRRDDQQPRQQGNGGERGGGEGREGREGGQGNQGSQGSQGRDSGQDNPASQNAQSEQGPTMERNDSAPRQDREQPSGNFSERSEPRARDSEREMRPERDASPPPAESAPRSEPPAAPRLQSWEPPASGGTTSYTVWSSGPAEQDPPGRDRE